MPNHPVTFQVVCLIDRLGRGGAPAHLKVLLPGLKRRGVLVRLVCLKDDGGLAEEFRALGLPVLCLGIQKLVSLHALRRLGTLRRLCRPRNASQKTVLLCYLFSSSIFGAVLRFFTRDLRLAIAWRDTGHWLDERRRRALAWASRRADLLTANSAAVEEAARRTAGPRAPLRRIYNGVPLTPEVRRVPEESPATVGMLARFSPEKGHDLLLRAAALLQGRDRPFRVLLGGEGDTLPAARALSESLGLSRAVTFLGRVDDPESFYGAVDLLAAPSRAEGFSNAILEAMARGLPVVAARVGGIPEAVKDGETGLLVPTEDPEALSRAIERLMDHPEERRRMGRAGRARAERDFSVSLMVEKTAAALAETVALGVPAEPPPGHVAHVVSQFPCYDETFILREIAAVERRGLATTIFSLKPCRDAIVHPEAEALRPRLVQWPLLGSPRTWGGALASLLRHPLRALGALGEIFISLGRSRDFLTKGLALFPLACAYAREAGRRGVTHLHAQWATHPATLALVIHRLTRIPWSLSAHAHDLHLNATGLAHKMRSASFVLTCTKANKTLLLERAPGLLPERIHVIYHGLDIRTAYVPAPDPPPERPFRILSVGSLLPCKGFDRLLRACRLLHDKGLDLMLTLAGGGPLESELVKLSRDLGLDGRVAFPGFVTQDRMPELYRRHHVFALAAVPGIHWGIPNVVVEAMASGLPVVTTALPSLAEVIRSEEEGLLVPDPTPEALGPLLGRLAGDPELRGRLGRAGRKRVEEMFDIESTSRAMAALFQGGAEKPSP
ncbi:MAG: glycosyltransferase [Planctomycetota bacterium]